MVSSFFATSCPPVLAQRTTPCRFKPSLLADPYVTRDPFSSTLIAGVLATLR
jgi:hypothetical protein